jgi:hypothetical protein
LKSLPKSWRATPSPESESLMGDVVASVNGLLKASVTWSGTANLLVGGACFQPIRWRRKRALSVTGIQHRGLVESFGRAEAASSLAGPPCGPGEAARSLAGRPGGRDPPANGHACWTIVELAKSAELANKWQTWPRRETCRETVESAMSAKSANCIWQTR